MAARSDPDDVAEGNSIESGMCLAVSSIAQEGAVLRAVGEGKGLHVEVALVRGLAGAIVEDEVVAECESLDAGEEIGIHQVAGEGRGVGGSGAADGEELEEHFMARASVPSALPACGCWDGRALQPSNLFRGTNDLRGEDLLGTLGEVDVDGSTELTNGSISIITLLGTILSDLRKFF